MTADPPREPSPDDPVELSRTATDTRELPRRHSDDEHLFDAIDGSRRALSVSIVIPAKNGRPLVAGCLEGVMAQEYDGDVEVLVIDSGSTDGSLEDYARFPDVRVHHIHPAAFDHGDTRNLGAGMTSGEAIVFLVQDAEPVGPHWLRDLVSNLEDPQVGGAFSRILPRPDAGPLVKRGCEGDLCYGTERVEARMSSRAEWDALDPHALRVLCNFNDVSSVVRRSLWERMPLVRGMFGEDIRFARSALEAGWTIVFDPRSEVLHSHEYEAKTVFARTKVDAEMNMQFLGRPCIHSLRDAAIMTGRSWKDDRRFLAGLDLPLGERAKWTALSPVYHFMEFYGFYAGGRDAIAEGRGAPGRRSPVPVPTDGGPLKILMAVHGFPPDSWAGVEVLSLTLARGLRARGHEVVFFVRTPGTPEEADRTLHAGEFDGFTVHRFVNRLDFGGVEETYLCADAEAAFDQVVAAERPDVVHVQHMIHLSTGIIDRCRVHGVPSVVTLSDFWARCPRVQLIRPDKRNCTAPPPGLGCAACVKDAPQLIEPLRWIDKLLGPLPARWAAGVPQTIPAPPPGWRKRKEDAAALLRRERWMVDVLSRADRIVVPSFTLRESLAEAGVPTAAICLSEYGLDTAWIDQAPTDPATGRLIRTPRPEGAPLRVGFVGSLVWYKGLATVARAVAAMGGRAHLHVHGDHEGGADPTAAADVRRVADEARALAGDAITFHGRFPHDELAAIHAELDVLVVPSIWQEAYGLTVREAHLAGTPVVGSDIAGIAEGIRHEVDGLLFEPGDAADLRRQLERLLDEPDLDAQLAAGAPPIKTVADDAREAEWRYRQVVSAALGARAAASPASTSVGAPT